MVYVTQYALTKGILVFKDVEHCIDINIDMICIRRGGFMTMFHGDDWHASETAAKAKFEEMRIKAISNLQKKLKKLDNLKPQFITEG